MRSRPRQNRPRIGVSACLLGDKVRYDGTDRRDTFLVDVLGQQVEWVRVCPEVEVGMGTPRETLQLVQSDGRLRMMTTRTGHDYTDLMEHWAARRVDELARENLCGYVFKKNSPSCGPEGVPTYEPNGGPAGEGRGLFAEALIRKFPGLPVEDEGRLSAPEVQTAFIERVFAYWRAQHD